MASRDRLEGGAVKAVTALLSQYDVILQPTLSDESDPLNLSSQSSVYNLSGHAAGSMSIGMSDAGLSIGLHVAVKSCGDTPLAATNSTALLLQVMQRVAQAVRWRQPPPALTYDLVSNARAILPFVEKRVFV